MILVVVAVIVVTCTISAVIMSDSFIPPYFMDDNKVKVGETMNHSIINMNMGKSSSSISVMTNSKECIITRNGIETVIPIRSKNVFIDVTDESVYINGNRVILNDELPQEPKKLTLWQRIKLFLVDGI